MARESKLDEEMLTEFIAAVSEGTPIGIVCECVGITRRTYERWRQRGKLTEDEADIYFRFRRESKKALGKAKQFHVRNIVRASETTWQASAWWLERVCAETFSNNAREIRELRKEVSELAELVRSHQAKRGLS